MKIISSAPLTAQPYYFRNYGEAEGVSSNTITCIAQDNKGFMWFGTRNGLNRFDGYSFRIFRNVAADTSSLISNSIFSLCEDENKKIWIGTAKGISIYDPTKESFSCFEPLGQAEVRYVTRDRGNNMWIVADEVLYKYNKHDYVLKPYYFQKTSVISLTISHEGAIIAGTSNNIIKIYDRGQDDFIDYDISAHVLHAPNAIQSICAISDSLLIIGTSRSALLLNTKLNRISNLFKEAGWNGNLYIHNILPRSKTEYWFGTETGLFILDLDSKKQRVIKKERHNPFSITDNVIYSSYKDKEGGIWLGTFFGGVNYYTDQYSHFHKYFPLAGTNSLSGNLVHEICSDKNGNLWIGTEDGGLNKLDTKTGNISHFLPTGNGSISYLNIHGLLAVDNELWIGTYEHGLDVLDLRTEKVIRHYNGGKGPNDLKGNFIVTIAKNRKNEVLVGTWNGLFIYDRIKNNFIPHPFFQMQIQNIHEDEDETLWVASYGKGVYYYNERTGLKGRLQYKAAEANSLSNDYVNSLFEDSDGMLWICTENGLTKYDRQHNAFTRFAITNGLPDNQVFRVEEDENKNLWISTGKGLCCLNRKTMQIKTYTTANGLLSNQFNYNSSLARDNVLYFGSVKGMISFDPTKFVLKRYVPPVYITNIAINNVEANPSTSPYLSESIIEAKQLTIPYDSSSLSFDIAALSFANPLMNTYAYKMEGFDKDWTNINTNRRIYYTKLPPGSYTFKVKGSNGGEIWNNQETAIKINVLPPFWATPAAYAIYVIIATGIIVTILRYYQLAGKEKHKRRFEAFERQKEREVYNAKIEFFTNIAHEIRTPLTLIKLPFEKLLKKNHEPEIFESLQTMNKNINRLVDLTNQLLDFRKAEASNFSLNYIKANVTELLHEVHTAFKPIIEQKGLEHRLEVPRIPLHAYIDAEAFQKIMSNLFSNAVKYAEKNIHVKLLPFNSEDNYFTIQVKNDGYLIPPDLSQKIFEPFFRIKETDRNEGTGIGLPLSRALAELHKGTLEHKPNTEDGLNTFVLSLPIHQENEMNFVKETQDITKNEADADDDVAGHDKPVVLVAEDNTEILNFIQKELSAQFRVVKAFNGVEALETLTRENVQLIISDIMMPRMNGIDLCRKVKTDIEFSHIPFILLTAKNTLQSKIEGLEVGADAYIEKPFSFEHLQAQITNLITNRQIIKDHFARSPLSHIKGIAYSSADKNFLEELNRRIEENITNFNLDVDQLSRLMNMSRTTLYRKIKGISNLTPNELINITRLKKAAELLAQGKYKINEVASIVGYTVLPNFSRDFHKQFGLTPTAYINNLLQEE